jgi:S1-C subfamily serine protease
MRSAAAQSEARRQFEPDDEFSTNELANMLQGAVLANQDKAHLRSSRDVVLTASDTSRLRDEDWRVNIVADKGGAVCKVITHMVTFDFEMPFKSSESGAAIGTAFFVDLKSLNVPSELSSKGDRYLVTNAHVIEYAAKVWVTTPQTGEERFDAEICGVCALPVV